MRMQMRRNLCRTAAAAEASGGDTIEHLRFAFESMTKQLADKVLRLGDRSAVGRVVQQIGAPQQAIQAGHVGQHVAIRR